jgi:hypothetical protein
MSWVAAAAASAAATGAVIKGIRARNQRKKANKIKPVRPTLERTNASKEAEQNARAAAMSTRLPGQSYMENQIGSQTARTNNAIQQTGRSSGEIISGLTASDENARRSTNDLALEGAHLNQQNRQLFSNVLNNVSNDEKEMFDYNMNQPFQTETLRKQALLDASARNTDSAISSLENAGSNFGTSMQYNSANNSNKSNYMGSAPSAGTSNRRRNS